ncbi:MAG: hypothetical protein AAB729_06030 [Patescibacteria group bacterium]
MKKSILIIAFLSLLAAGCGKVVLKQEIPSSPKESYQELPK